MKVEESRISKANICPYLGREIPNFQALGLEPEKTYRLFRDPKELEKGASTFDGKPLLIRHVPIDASLPRKELWVGTVGTCTFESPYLVTRPLVVLTKEAIDLIESNEQGELSSAYRYEAEMTPGTWGGEPYDGVMRNIQGNHVAIVSEGRAGPDVRVADELPVELRRMKPAAQGIFDSIKGYLGKDAKLALVQMALDGGLGEVPAESVLSLDEHEKEEAEDAWRKAHDRKAEDAMTDEEREEAYERARDRKAKDKKARDAKRAKDKAAEDGGLDAREEACDAREAAMDAKEEEDDEGKEDEEAKDRKRARDKRAKDRAMRAKDRKRAKDSDPDHRKDFEPILGKGGEDSVTKDELPAILKAHEDKIRNQMRQAAEAREKVRPIVGVVPIAMDSAEDIYRFALKHSGVKAERVKDLDALSAMVDMAVQTKARASREPIAMDSSHASLVDIDALFGPQKAA